MRLNDLFSSITLSLRRLNMTGHYRVHTTLQAGSPIGGSQLPRTLGLVMASDLECSDTSRACKVAVGFKIKS